MNYVNGNKLCEDRKRVTALGVSFYVWLTLWLVVGGGIYV